VNPYIAQLRNGNNGNNRNTVRPNMNSPIIRNTPRNPPPRPVPIYSNSEDSGGDSDIEIDLENIIIRKNVKNSPKKTFTEKDYENIRKIYDEESKGAECLICYEETKNTVLVFCCKKFFCGECLAKWIYTNDTCPHCREEGIVIHSPELIEGNCGTVGNDPENILWTDDDYI
jgi:hypothetical protein